jgi:hypothetical protein
MSWDTEYSPNLKILLDQATPTPRTQTHGTVEPGELNGLFAPSVPDCKRALGGSW